MAPRMTDEEVRALRTLTNALRKLREHASDEQFLDEKGRAPELPLQQILFLLAVAQREGANLNEICSDLDMAQSTASRNAIQLAARNRPGERPGLGLIDVRTDPMDDRRKVYTLTPRGRGMVQAFIKALH